MGYILLVVLVVTVYGTDLVLQRFLHSTDEEVALQRAVDALCADLSTLRAWQAAVDTEVALLCAAADASEAEFANLRQHQTKVDPEVKAAANGSANNVDNARETFGKARASRQSQVRLGVAAGLVAGVLLGSIFGRV